MEETICENCGYPRIDKKRTEPCELCGSRKYPFPLGYLYEHEEATVRKFWWWLAGIILIAPLLWLILFHLIYGVGVMDVILFVLLGLWGSNLP